MNDKSRQTVLWLALLELHSLKAKVSIL